MEQRRTRGFAETAAAEDAELRRILHRWVGAADLERRRIIAILHPLPDVAGEVEDAEG